MSFHEQADAIIGPVKGTSIHFVENPLKPMEIK